MINAYFNRFLLVALLFVGLISSCSKDSTTEIDVINDIPEPTKKVFSTVHGLIYNNQDELVEAAEITVGDDTVMSDENGFFTVSGFYNEKGERIKVKKPGYFTANGLIVPSVDARIKVNIILESDGSTINFSSAEDREIQIEESSVTLAADAYQDVNDNPYQGTVTVSAKYTDPTSEDFSKKYPGHMASKESLDRGIVPFSIITVDLYDESGQQLQISQDAQVAMRVPDDLLSAAPMTVPLWYLDDQSGLWIQEGEATLDGNHYRATVSHFTDWMVGVSGEFYTITGTVTQDGEVYPDADMGITYSNQYSFRTSFRSDDQGRYTLRIVVILDLGISYSYGINVISQCGKILYEQNMLQLTEADMTLDINVTGAESFRLFGNIYCESPDSKVTDGYILLEFAESSVSEVIASDSEGNFEFFYEDCGLGRATVRAYDPTNQTKSRAIPITTANDGSAPLEIDICEEELTSSVTFSVDGENDYVISNCRVTVIDTAFVGVEFLYYEFIFTDYFSSYPDVSDEFIEYKLGVNVSKNIPDQPTPPNGPLIEILSQSENPPREWDFAPTPYELVSESDELVVMNIVLGSPFPGNYKENGVTKNVTGVVRFEATKN